MCVVLHPRLSWQHNAVDKKSDHYVEPNTFLDLCREVRPWIDAYDLEDIIVILLVVMYSISQVSI